MKRIFQLFILALTTLTFTACVSTATPNLKGKPDNSSTVFIYIPSATGTMDGMSNVYYKLYIDGKLVRGDMSDGEHKRLYLKPGSTKISIVRSHMPAESIVIDLKVDETYFLKVANYLDSGMIQISEMDKENGKKEFGLTRCMKIPETNIIFKDFIE
jgi:hypothetical protein